MKVLFVTGEFPPMQGGVGDYTREIGQALADLGCEVHILASTAAGPAPKLAVHPIVERWDWGCWRVLLDTIDSHSPDVVHVQYQAAAYAMHPAINLWPRRLRWKGLPRPRSVVTFHDLKVPYLFPKAGPLRRQVVTELARQSDAAITTNREDWQSLQQSLGRPPALIPIGSNITPQFPPEVDRPAWRRRWGAGPEDLLLCFFGFINDRKGIDVLLHALHHLVSGLVPRARLLFIGGQTGASDPTNARYLLQIQQLIAELGLEERVQWTGYLAGEEVSACFRASDLCVLPFRDGVSFLHGTFHAALAHGGPIVTTRPRIALPELSDGGNVALVPPEDPQALAQAIAQWASDPEGRQRLGRGALALAAEFRWDKIAADTLALYRSLAANP